MWGCRAGLRPFPAGGNPGRVPGRGDFKQKTQSSTSLALRPLGDFLNTTGLKTLPSLGICKTGPERTGPHTLEASSSSDLYASPSRPIPCKT